MKVGGHTKASDLSRIQWELIENTDVGQGKNLTYTSRLLC